MKFEKEYKKLIKTYTKKLNSLHKTNLQNLSANLDYFVVNLQFLRDYFILTEELINDGHENMKIATIATAIKEYQNYVNCINNYFNISATNVTPKVTGTKEEIMEAYRKEKSYHWKAFWEILKDHSEDWGIVNA